MYVQNSITINVLKTIKYFYRETLGNFIKNFWLYLDVIKKNNIYIRQFITENNAYKQTSNLSLHFKNLSIMQYLPKNFKNYIKKVCTKLKSYNKNFNVKNFADNIAYAFRLKSAEFLCEILQILLTLTGWKPKLWMAAIKLFKKTCQLTRKLSKYSMTIRLRLTGKWRGSGRTVIKKNKYWIN